MLPKLLLLYPTEFRKAMASSTRGFLATLDDDLATADAKFNIADTKVLKEMEDSAISEFLLNALYD